MAVMRFDLLVGISDGRKCPSVWWCHVVLLTPMKENGSNNETQLYSVF